MTLPLEEQNLSTPPATPMAHLVGICGSGMRALAEFLADQGWSLTGSDLSASERTTGGLERLGIRISKGHATDNVPAGTSLLVYSPAVPETNVERRRAQELGIAQLSYVEAVAELTRRQPTICVAGTHGKSTVTAMIACVLNAAGLAPSMICGAELRTVHRSGFAQSGEILVLESCEYRRHFLSYSPTAALILSTEQDHFDCYPAHSAGVEAFNEFANLVPKGGFLIHAGDWEPPATCQARTFPLPAFRVKSERPRWEFHDVEYHADTGLTEFVATLDGVPAEEFVIPVPGKHNVYNALAAIVACEDMGLSAKAIREGLLQFPGLRRRFEVLSWRGRTCIDDYAHHPTAIHALHQTARTVFPERRLVAAFQPHQISRTRMLLHRYAEALCRFDEVFILPVFPAREKATDDVRLASQELVQLIQSTGKRAGFVDDLDHLARTLETASTSDDIVLTIGAGDIDRIHHELA